MARKIQDISDEIKKMVVQNSVLCNAFGLSGSGLTEYNSKISEAGILTQIIWIIAAAIATLENMFDRFKAEVIHIVERERYGSLGWYKKVAKQFQFGANVIDTYSENPPDDWAEMTHYAIIDKSAQIVKYAEAEDEISGVLLKVATEDKSSIKALSTKEKTAFVAYIKRIKPAGVNVVVRSEASDQLKLIIDIFYDPVIMDSSGKLLNDGSEPIKTAIVNYLKSIDFNGEFIRMKLVDYIQQVEGVEICEITGATAFFGTNQNAQTITTKYRPYSGYIDVDSVIKPSNLTLNFYINTGQNV